MPVHFDFSRANNSTENFHILQGGERKEDRERVRGEKKPNFCTCYAPAPTYPRASFWPLPTRCLVKPFISAYRRQGRKVYAVKVWESRSILYEVGAITLYLSTNFGAPKATTVAIEGRKNVVNSIHRPRGVFLSPTWTFNDAIFA